MNSEKVKYISFLFFIITLIIIGIVFYFLKSNININANSTNEVNLIDIHIAGSIRNPGVYKIKDKSSISEAVNLAGGFDDNVDLAMVNKYINLSYILKSGDKIYIYKKGDLVEGLVNINSDSITKIVSIPTITLDQALLIISNRPYQKTEDLILKKVLSDKVFQKIKGYIYI